MAFIKARSLSQTMTLGPTYDVKSDPLNFYSARMEFFSLSLDKNAKLAEKDKAHQQSQAKATDICLFCKSYPSRI